MPVQVSTQFHKILITASANERATLAKAIRFYIQNVELVDATFHVRNKIAYMIRGTIKKQIGARAIGLKYPSLSLNNTNTQCSVAIITLKLH
jgi:hypothetical protein